MTKAGELLVAINEMARVGSFANMKVEINSKDHEPPHVYLLKDRELVAKVTIPNKDVKNSSDHGVSMKNYKYAAITWDSLHPKD